MTDRELNDDELIKQKDKFESLMNKQVENINNSETEAVRQLILVATVFLTASLFVFQKDGTKDVITGIYKPILIISWISFGISMLLGALIFIKDRAFFSQWSNAAEKIAKAISQRLVTTQNKIDRLVDLEYSYLSENTSDIYLYAQIVFIIIGAICLFVVGFKLIF